MTSGEKVKDKNYFYGMQWLFLKGTMHKKTKNICLSALYGLFLKTFDDPL